ncbi:MULTISPECIES: DUF2795 domain-containing protein [Pandoraea]|uniref:DUF2795 domain-containing protein n=1 Tax=Pandoraea sputorum TaxID=93222 RepID=A0A5E5BHR7_9BURK|nr:MULTISPECIES: DUF2795 domain-containing protein [Pandoraea]MCI3208071.1 hypothetical protein [Pandoraea sp. LA3]MDN4586100.1 hypothetical protein [Pandoraea capi]VVE84575.1 hypothetical protein PSP31121_04820 [Pandoraea sputorum]
MTSHHPQHTGHELSRTRSHEGDRATHDKGGHQTGHNQPPSPVDVQKALKGMDYPCSKAELLSCARDQHADRKVLDTLQHIPDIEYKSPASVSKELGKLM